MKKMLIIFTVFLIAIAISFVFIRNYNMTRFPQKSDFLLNADVSSNTLKAGNTLKVNAVFENLTESKCKLGYGNLQGDTGIIMIHVLDSNINDNYFISDDIMKFTELNSKQKITDTRDFRLDKPGKYTVSVAVNFHSFNILGEMKKEPIIISKEINVEVK